MKTLLLITILFIITTGTAFACRSNYIPTPSPTIEPTIQPSLEPTLTIEPTPTAGASATESHGDGLSDGRSDGLSSCPECTKAHVLPAAPPSTGRGL